MENGRSLDELEATLQRFFLIDDYLELRRRFPEKDTPLWMVMGSNDSSPSFGLDFALQLQDQLENFGVHIKKFLNALDGDPGKIDLLCLAVLEALSRREKIELKNAHAVASGLAIGDALVDFLCGAVLKCVSYHDLPLPHSFQILVKYRLGLSENSITEERALKQRRTRVAAFIAENTGAIAREIAKKTGLSPSTITRWMSDENFVRYIMLYRMGPLRLTKGNSRIHERI